MSAVTPTEVPQDELTALKVRAKQMGLSFHPSIGLDKLRKKVAAQITGEEQTPEVAAPPSTITPPAESTHIPVPRVETKVQRTARKRKEASRLVRVMVTCMNPAKKQWEGEMFTCGNSLVGSFREFVPFDNDAGWHIPQMIVNQILERKCQVFYTAKTSRGNTTRKGKLIKEFNVVIMDPLTKDEMGELAQRQALANSID